MIYVPEAAARVHVVGEVREPGAYPYEESMTVLKLITLAGGLTHKAATKRIRSLRTHERQVVEVPLALGDSVQPEDIVEVPTLIW